MSERFSFQRGLVLVIFNQYKHIPDDDVVWKRMLESMAASSVMKIMLRSVYKRLVAEKEIKPLEEQPEDHKSELWEAAKMCLKDADQPERMEFCMSQMGLLWILNN